MDTMFVNVLCEDEEGHVYFYFIISDLGDGILEIVGKSKNF